MLFKNADVYIQGCIRRLDVAVGPDGVITDMAPALEGPGMDCTGLLFLPPLADLHTHGWLGIDFTQAGREDLDRMTGWYRKRGVGRFLPTIISSPREAYPAIRQRLAGLPLRLEGPFFGPEKKGAHAESCLMPPDRGLLEALGTDGLAMVDVDPTRPGALELIEWLEGQGVRTSIAHTTATYQQAMAAFDRGCRHVTHLFNAMNGLHHRESGVLGAAFDRHDVTVELICDGFHISPPVLRMAFALYGGRICVISDSHCTMGMGAGDVARLPDGTIAGAVQGVGETVFNLERWGIPLEEAVRAAVETPCRVMGWEAPVIAPGAPAEFTAFDRSKNNVPAWICAGGRLEYMEV